MALLTVNVLDMEHGTQHSLSDVGRPSPYNCL